MSDVHTGHRSPKQAREASLSQVRVVDILLASLTIVLVTLFTNVLMSIDVHHTQSTVQLNETWRMHYYAHPMRITMSVRSKSRHTCINHLSATT